MKYMLLIYDAESVWETMSEADRGAVFAEYGKFTNEIVEAGKFVAGAPLKPIATATSVRVRDGESFVTDGPFAETHEQLGGYYIVDAVDLDEALSLAARIPSARFGTIEVRPVMEM